jgi:hypothetical protein
MIYGNIATGQKISNTLNKEADVTALLIQLAPLILSVLAPVLTEMVKALAVKVNTSVPPNVVPILGSVVGALVAGLTQAVDPSIPVNPVIGAVAGLAGTGIHQAVFANRYIKNAPAPPVLPVQP